jgi:hypothetical protein
VCQIMSSHPEADKPSGYVSEELARAIFARAMLDGRCAELLDHLFDGGGVTLDASSGDLVLVSDDFLSQLAAGGER